MTLNIWETDVRSTSNDGIGLEKMMALVVAVRTWTGSRRHHHRMPSTAMGAAALPSLTDDVVGGGDRVRQSRRRRSSLRVVVGGCADANNDDERNRVGYPKIAETVLMAGRRNRSSHSR